MKSEATQITCDFWGGQGFIWPLLWSQGEAFPQKKREVGRQ